MKIKLWEPPEWGKKFNTAVEKHNAIATQYEEQYDTVYWKLYDRLTWDHMISILQTHMINRRGKILDAGGGTGKWARRLAKLGYKVDVLDKSDDMISVGKGIVEQAKLEGMVEFIKGDIVDLPFESNSYDAVISQGNPICYCSDSEAAISELARVAKLGTPLVFSVHNRTAMIQYFCYMHGAISIDEAIELSKTGRVKIDYPRKAYLPSELKEAAIRNGLDVVSLIGKPVITGFAQTEPYLRFLNDPESFEKTVQLEKVYWADQTLLGMAGHLEVGCVKK